MKKKLITFFVSLFVLTLIFCNVAMANSYDDIIINRGDILTYADFAELKVIIDNEGPFTDQQVKELIVNKIIEKENEALVVTPLYTIFGTELTGEELLLVAAFPTEAVLVYNCAQVAQDQTNSWYQSSTLYQGNGDAFRHGYWNAMMVNNVGSSMAKAFADAHESESSGVDKQMDLYNNEQGRYVGSNYTPSSYKYAVRNRVDYGLMRRIVNGQLVPTDSSGKL